jgi:hypothetical protein
MRQRDAAETVTQSEETEKKIFETNECRFLLDG